MTDDAVIRTEGLSRHFGETKALDGLTIEVEAGEVFGCLGHNGAGKTTTVRLLNGVLTPTSGSAWVLGLDPISQGPALRALTGVLTETPAVEDRLSGRENLRVYADLYGVPAERVDRRVTEMLARFGLMDAADAPAGSYSRGMRQRLALARAFLHNPELIFLDEPTAGLDPVAARGVRDLIRELAGRGGRTVFLCTHNLAEAQALCSRVAVLEHGRLIALGTPGQLSERYGGASRLHIEVSADTQERALRVLQSSGAKPEEGPDDGNIIVPGIQRGSIPGMLEHLVSAGVRVYQVMARRPTLEDVYFELHRQEREEI